MSNQMALSALYAAKQAKYGIVIATSSSTQAKTELYKVRKETGDVSLANIQIKLSPTNPVGEIWLLNMPEEG